METTQLNTDTDWFADKQIKTDYTSYRARFLSRKHAFSFANNSYKPLRVILGDDDRFWVVTPAYAECLCKAGYEYAN